MSEPTTSRRWLPAVHPWAIGILFASLACAILLVPLGTNQDETLNLQVGDLAPFDIVAPRSQTYISMIQTDSAKAAAEASVSPVYDPPDTRIARQQVNAARGALGFVNSVRADIWASNEQKRKDLSHLSNIYLSDDLQIQLLEIEESRWVTVQAEVKRVIEVAMSEPIREHHIEETRTRIPMMASVDVTVEEAELAAALATQFIIPNSLFNERATEQAREAAISAVQPVEQAFAQG